MRPIVSLFSEDEDELLSFKTDFGIIYTIKYLINVPGVHDCQ